MRKSAADLGSDCLGIGSHLKPGEIELTMQELEENIGDFRPRMLQNNHVFEF